MIRLHNQGGYFYLNPDLIKRIDQPHNTRIELVSGEALIVDDPVEDVVRAFVEYQRAIRRADLGARERA